MSSIQTAQQVLWLDPVQPLQASEQDQLASAGISVRSIQTLDELQAEIKNIPVTPPPPVSPPQKRRRTR